MSIYDFDRDDFWDIQKLVPKKKHTASPFISKPVTREYEISGEDSDNSKNKLSFDEYKCDETPEQTSYTPEGDGLIKRVTIKRFVDKYDFYGNFRKAALIYFDYKTDKCKFAPFYSYMPQYSQLTDDQKSYYFYWRFEFKNNRIIKSDYSYIYLFVYEILNLPDKIPRAEGILLLTRLWREYRASLPRIDSYFLSWVQDYCLVHRISLPFEEVSSFIFSALQLSNFREFYISDYGKDSERSVELMTAYLSDYDWRRGRYAGEGKDEKYKSLMTGALSRFIPLLMTEFSHLKDRDTATISRDAFPHSLCTHSVKCKLLIEYYPIARDERLRSLVTLGVRYTENKLRAIYGIKSRLAVKDFPDNYKKVIDSYFDKIAYEKARAEAKENIPEYEKLYDAPSGEMTFAMADEIEKASWTNTYKLVDECEEMNKPDDNVGQNESMVDVSSTTCVDAEISSDGASENNYGLMPCDIENIRLAFSGVGFSSDASAERINEAFSDNFGDVILERSCDVYTIIDDYKEDIELWLQSLVK